MALRGRGFALSARDVGRALSWYERGVPLRLALEVIEDALRRWRTDGGLRQPTLGGMERTIQAAMKRRAERRVLETTDSGADPEAFERLKAAVEAAGRACDDERQRAILRQTWTALGRSEAGGQDPWTVAPELDQRQLESFEAFLSAAERAERDRDVAEVVARSPQRMSAAALSERRAFETAAWTRTRFGLPDLIGVLLR